MRSPNHQRRSLGVSRNLMSVKSAYSVPPGSATPPLDRTRPTSCREQADIVDMAALGKIIRKRYDQTVQTRVDRWLALQPLWRYVTIAYVSGFALCTAAVYVAAWGSGGIRAGDAGFPHGTFSFSFALISAAMWTVIWVGFRWRRQGRKAIFWVLLLAAIVVGGFLTAVTPA